MNKELDRHLDEQVRFLQKSCKEFDKGDISESKRLAVQLRVLLHDTNHSTSLLNLLDLKKDFLDTALDFNYEEGIRKTETSLCLNLLNNSLHHYKPLFDSNKEACTISFKKWWEEDIIISDYEGNTYTRKYLVLSFANQDGGAHVDLALKTKYKALTRENSAGAFVMENVDPKNPLPDRIDFSKMKKVTSPAYYSVRQVTHEVLKTLGTDACALEDYYHGTEIGTIGFG